MEQSFCYPTINIYLDKLNRTKLEVKTLTTCLSRTVSFDFEQCQLWWRVFCLLVVFCCWIYAVQPMKLNVSNEQMFECATFYVFKILFRGAHNLKHLCVLGMTGRPGFNLFLDLDLENVKSGTLIRLVSLEIFTKVSFWKFQVIRLYKCIIW